LGLSNLIHSGASIEHVIAKIEAAKEYEIYQIRL
jgi:hypothetical protein